MGRFLDLTGQRYGRLVVLHQGEKRSDGTITWVCVCDCGTVLEVRRHDLRSGNTQSCGCLQREKASAMPNRGVGKPKYGSENEITRLRNVWGRMKQRCSNPKAHGYRYYGGRGIKVCDEWQDFGAFLDWAKSSGYDHLAPNGICTIDRIDVNGNYEPQNCRWVSMKEQNRNRRPRSCRRLET